jgi:hypothetical protein
MMMNRKSLLTTALAVVMAFSAVSAAKAASSIEFATTTFTISKLGDLTLVLKEGVPKAIEARGQEFTRMGAYPKFEGMVRKADVVLTSNLSLLPDTMPLKFEHEGYVNFTVGADMISLKYGGKATKTKDMAMGTKTLSSYGDFVITKASGEFAGLEGVMGKYTLTLVCHGMPGEKPEAGKPVDVTFSAMGM